MLPAIKQPSRSEPNFSSSTLLYSYDCVPHKPLCPTLFPTMLCVPLSSSLEILTIPLLNWLNRRSVPHNNPSHFYRFSLLTAHLIFSVRAPLLYISVYILIYQNQCTMQTLNSKRSFVCRSLSVQI